MCLSSIFFLNLFCWCLQSFLKHLANQAGLNLAQYVGTGNTYYIVR